jgi:hypothetical protein
MTAPELLEEIRDCDRLYDLLEADALERDLVPAVMAKNQRTTRRTDRPRLPRHPERLATLAEQPKEMTMKLRIARTGSFRANVNVPSPTIESMIEGVREPLNRRDIVRQEVEFGNKPAPTKSTPSSAPAPPDLGEAIRKQRG